MSVIHFPWPSAQKELEELEDKSQLKACVLQTAHIFGCLVPKPSDIKTSIVPLDAPLCVLIIKHQLCSGG